MQKLVGRLQRGPAGAADDAAGISRRRTAAVPAVLALGPDRAVADGDRRSGRSERLGRPRPPIASRTHAFGFPDDHGALGGHLHARADDERRCRSLPAPTALNQVLVLNGFGTAADEVARRTSMEFLRTIDTAIDARGRGASRTTQQALDIGQTLQQRRHAWRRCSRTRRSGNQLKQVAKVIKFNGDVAGARAEPADLLLSAGRVRHASGSARHAVEPAGAGEPGDQGVLRRDASSWGWSSRSRRSHSRTSAARCSRPDRATTSWAPITRGATTISWSAERCAAATSTA